MFRNIKTFIIISFNLKFMVIKIITKIFQINQEHKEKSCYVIRGLTKNDEI